MLDARSNFDLYKDEGKQMKKWLEEVGFKNVKIWEQPINIFYKNGEDYVNKMGDSRIKREAKVRGFSEEQVL